MGGQYKGYILVLLAIAVWTPVAIFIRELRDFINPLNMLFWRYAFAIFAILTFLVYFPGRLRRFVWTSEGIRNYFFLGLFYTGCLFFFIIAVEEVTIANASFLQQLNPLWAFLLAPVMLKEKANPVLYLALALSVTGIFFIFFDPNELSKSILGNVSAIISGIFLALYSLLARAMARKGYNPLNSVYLALLFGIVLVVLISLFFPSMHISKPKMPAEKWFELILFGIGSTALPFILYFKGLEYIQAQRGTLFQQLFAITVPFSAYLAYKEIPSNFSVTGGALIVLSVLIVLLTRK